MSGRRHRGPVVIFPDGRMLKAGNRSPMTLDGTRTFIIGSERAVVIDPGPPDAAHLEALLRLLDGSTLAGILLTHGHGDHAGGAGALADRTGAPILMGERARRLPFPRERVATWLADGDTVDCDAGPIRTVATPGHAPEHLSFLYDIGGDLRALFAGDLFLGRGDTTVVSHPEGNVADYLRSLEVVRKLSPTVIFPAHGRPLRHPERAIARFRAHRWGRIEQVRRLRESHPEGGVEALAEAVYGPELHPRLRPAALGSIAAILAFLDSETKLCANK